MSNAYPGEEDKPGDLPPQEIDRMFNLLEQAIAEDALTGGQLNRLLSILEQAVGTPGATNPETVAELISMLEEFLIEPDDLNEVEVDGILGLFEEALGGVSLANSDDLADVFDVLSDGLRDPASLDPEDVDRFQVGVQNTLLGMADPVGGFFSLPLFRNEQAFDEQPFDDQTFDEQGLLDPFRLGRLAAAMTQRASGYSVESGIRTATRMAYAAANAESATELLTSARAITLDELERAGVDIGDEQAAWLKAHEEDSIEPRPLTREALEARGERLITQSAEVGRDEATHPAFAPMLDQLATDEARILRLLALEGEQGAIDVYDKQYFPPRKWLVASNLTMLGQDAGCRNPGRTPVYLQNLERLRLVEVLGEPIANLKRYEVLEAQSHVELARDRAKRPRMKYKSVRLTDLGVEFCEMCFPFAVNAPARGRQLRKEARE